MAGIIFIQRYRRLAALLSLSLLALISAGCGQASVANGKPLTSATPTPTFFKHVSTPQPTPTFVPTPIPSPLVDARTAWGTISPVATVSTRVDATHIFQPTGITPDGKTLVGVLQPVDASGQIAQGQSTQAGLLDVASQRFTAIGVSSDPNYPPGCCQSDGRFVVATDSTAPGATCGICHVRIWSYDTATRQLWQVAVGGQYQGILGTYLNHGLLVMSTGEGVQLQVADLAARTIHALPQPTANGQSQVWVSAFVWPYLVYYHQTNAGADPHVYNLVTNQETPLAQVADLLRRYPAFSSTMTISGNTLFVVIRPPEATFAQMYETDHFDASGASLRLLGSTSAAGDGWANDRIVAGSGITALWDRAEARFVQFGSHAGILMLAGNFLAVEQDVPTGNSVAATQVDVYDTSRFPVLQ